MADTGSTPLKYSSGAPQETSLPITLFDSVMDKVRNWVDETDPASVKRAGDYYVAAHGLLQDAAVTLKQKAVDLAAKYNGPESVEAQKELQRLHASIRELAGKMREVGVPLQKYAETLTWAQRNIVTKRGEDSRTDHDTDWADNVPFYGMYRVERRARDRFNEINDRIVQHYQELPAEVQHSLPTPMKIELPDYRNVDLPSGPGGLTTAGPGGGDFGGSGAWPAVNGSGVDGLSPWDTDPGGSDPGGLNPSGQGPGTVDGSSSAPDGSGTGGPHPGGANGLDPNSLNPGGADGLGLNTTTPPGSGSDKTVLAGLNDRGTLGLPNGNGTLGLPNGTGTGPSFGNPPNGPSGTGLPNGMGGFGPAGAGSFDAGGRTRVGGSPMTPFMPPGGVAGAGAGQEKQDRENSTWLMEDDEVWGGAGDTIPPVIA